MPHRVVKQTRKQSYMESQQDMGAIIPSELKALNVLGEHEIKLWNKSWH